ncbi:MAG TPA: hypothetical protein ENH84_03610, partial [Phycisphaerae bacterium]|nr:hypothetical protein [Phycisphaerae bacterium]
VLILWVSRHGNIHLCRHQVFRDLHPCDRCCYRVKPWIGHLPQKNRNKTIMALRHAAGYLQEQMAKQIRLRRTPRLDFQIDQKLKKITETLNLLTEVTEELRERQQDTEPL